MEALMKNTAVKRFLCKDVHLSIYFSKGKIVTTDQNIEILEYREIKLSESNGHSMRMLNSQSTVLQL
jgi:hypothetical protein